MTFDVEVRGGDGKREKRTVVLTLLYSRKLTNLTRDFHVSLCKKSRD